MLLAPPHQPVRNPPRAAGIANILLARPGLLQIVRPLAARGKQVDLKHQHIVIRRRDDMLERRIRHQPAVPIPMPIDLDRSEEHTSELQSLMRISYAVFCLKKKNTKKKT